MFRLKTRGSDCSDRNMEQYVPLRCKIYKSSRFDTEYKVVAKCVIAGLFSFVKLSVSQSESHSEKNFLSEQKVTNHLTLVTDFTALCAIL